MEFIKKNTYELILEKKASLFVIYDENKPIDICLNHHFQNIVHHFIRSYDIDYSKYWLGQIDIYKQIDWCILNNFTVFDFMWGELTYKTRWCNEVSTYEHHFIYKNNLINHSLVRLKLKLYKFNDALKEKKLYKSFIKAKVTLTKSYQLKAKRQQPNIKVETLMKMPSSENIMKININNEANRNLRKTVYDFQYLNFENSSTIHVFKIQNHNNAFIIKGSNSQIKASVIFE